MLDNRPLDDFFTRFGELEAYWRHLSVSAQIREGADPKSGGEQLATLLSSVGQELTPGLRKTFDYASVVVALYGLVEDYVEAVAEGAVELLQASFGTYGDLPPLVRKNHEALSVRLAEQVAQTGYRGPLSVKAVISNLSGCLGAATPYRLNKEAFSHHTSNIRHELVRRMFANLGLSTIEQDMDSHELTLRLMDVLGRTPAESHFYIDDLADRRNVIAHGERPQDVLASAALPEYFAAVRTFAEVLFDSALVGLRKLTVFNGTVELGSPTAIYQKGFVVCLETPSAVTLSLGDRIFWPAGESWRTARVLSIQVKKIEYPEYDCVPGTKVGLGVDRKVKAGASYSAVKS